MGVLVTRLDRTNTVLHKYRHTTFLAGNHVFEKITFLNPPIFNSKIQNSKIQNSKIVSSSSKSVTNFGVVWILNLYD